MVHSLQLILLSQFQACSREPRIAEEASDGEDDAQEGVGPPGRQGTAVLQAAGRLHPSRVRARRAEQQVVRKSELPLYRGQVMLRPLLHWDGLVLVVGQGYVVF